MAPGVQGEQSRVSLSPLMGTAGVLDGGCVMVEAQTKAMRNHSVSPIIESCIRGTVFGGSERDSPLFSEGISIPCSHRQHYREIVGEMRVWH